MADDNQVLVPRNQRKVNERTYFKSTKQSAKMCYQNIFLLLSPLLIATLDAK